ncbi:hypothetical protein MMC30_009045 [Trapelia coarctata]|nr:hypothetical protein [Trapelia coarctata]
MSSENAKSLQYTSADRINQLNEIDRDVTTLLHSAGLAIKALTGHVPAESDEGSTSIEQQKEAFTSAASQYFSLLSSIDVRLRRQVYALEEAGIVSADVLQEIQSTLNVAAMPSAFAGPLTAAAGPQGNKEKSSVSGSGLGNLDVGWLNSRNDKVGKEMEAELWAEARELVQTFVKEQQCGTGKRNANGEMEAITAHNELEKAEPDDSSMTLIES